MDALVTELDRIAEKTTFNNQTVLDGSFIGAKFQIGANANDTITVGIKDARAGSLGRQVRETSVADITTTGAGDALQSGDIIFNGVNIRETSAADDSLSTSFAAASAISKAAAINDATEFTGVRAIVEETVIVGTADIGAVTLDSTTNLTINGSLITGFRVEANDATDTLVNAINAVSDDTGVVASLNEQNRLELSADDGRNIEVAMVGAAIGLAGGAGSLSQADD